MADKDGNRSNPYHLNPGQCCEKCCFGMGEHAAWCMIRWPGLIPVVIPSDCEFCEPEECREFGALGYLGEHGPAICSRCLVRGRHIEGQCGECGGTGEIVNDGPYSRCDDCNGTGRAPLSE